MCLGAGRSDMVGTAPPAAGIVRVHRATTRGATLGQRSVWVPDRSGRRRLRRAGPGLGRVLFHGSAALRTKDRVVWVARAAVWAIHSFTLLLRPASRTATHPAGSGQRNQPPAARIRPAPPPAGRGASRPARTTAPSARLRRRTASSHCRSGGIRRRRPS